MKRTMAIILIIFYVTFTFPLTLLFAQDQKITILKILDDKFAINKGSNYGIKINTYYIVIRNGKSICRAKVINVRENVSALKIINISSQNRINIGDELILDTTLDFESEDILMQSELNNFSKNPSYNKNPYNIHIKVSGYGLLTSWVVTALGSSIMGDTRLKTTIIPVVGPFITINKIENDPYSYYQPGGKALLTISGIVQSTFAVYSIISLIGCATWNPPSHVTVSPMIGFPGIQIVYNF